HRRRHPQARTDGRVRRSHGDAESCPRRRRRHVDARDRRRSGGRLSLRQRRRDHLVRAGAGTGPATRHRGRARAGQSGCRRDEGPPPAIRGALERQAGARRCGAAVVVRGAAALPVQLTTGLPGCETDEIKMPSMTLDEVVAEVSRLPAKWHGAGSLAPAVLDAIARHGSARPIQHSVETGTGKSTLVLSHCSADHTVFAQDDAGQGDSLVRVQGSPMLRRESVTFVVGATQRTLPRHQFDHPLDLVLVDGPHGYPFPEIEYYFLYPHLAPGGILIVDDIHIPTVF